jgi:predicted dinucleotide-binding enzyme
MRIGIVGAGMIGSTVAKLWVDAGHEVRLSSRHSEDLQPLVKRWLRRFLRLRAIALALRVGLPFPAAHVFVS